ncbi:Retrovirus-related Pol polyprotein from transposon TNT 1-94 [Linum perenne]
MTSDNGESLSIRFNGSNYEIWAFDFKYLIEGKELLQYLDGTIDKPKDDATATAKKAWSTGNAKVISLLLRSMEPKIALTLRTFTSAAEIWNHLKKTYDHVSTSRVFEVEYDLAKLTQGDMDIRSFYLATQTLWTEQDVLSTSLLPAAVSTEVQKERHRSRVLQFLMKLRPEFETVRSQLISANTTDIDSVLGDLVRAETRLKTQHLLDESSAPTGSVFAAQRPQSNYRPQFGSSFGSSVSTEPRCRHCNESGHIVSHCKKRNFCNYCKKPGHIILDCRARRRTSGYNNSYNGNYSNGGGNSSTGGGSNFSNSNRGSYSVQTGGHDNNIEQLVHSALQKVLPSALNMAFSAYTSSGNSNSWFLDSASFNHMTGNSSLFRSYRPATSKMDVQVANGQRLVVSGIGDVAAGSIVLRNTLHVPSLVPNLVSVGQLVDDNCIVSFSPYGCSVQDLNTRKVIGRGRKDGRNFLVSDLDAAKEQDVLSKESVASQPFGFSVASLDKVISSDSLSTFNNSTKRWNLWHFRLGHPNNARLRFMFENNLLPDRVRFKDIDDSIHTCVHCLSAKASKLPFHSSSTTVSMPFDLVHTDLWGPSPVTSRLGFRYFALFVDHATRFTWIYFLRLKSDLLKVVQEFVMMIQTQFHTTVKVFRSDPGGEYTSNALHDFYKKHGILSQQSCPGVSQQNGLVERKNRHVLELARALLLHSQVPPHFWPEVAHTVVYLINRQVTSTIQDQSPYFALYGKQPDYKRLKVFGCTCLVLLPRHERSKLTSKVARCAFLGYSDVHKGYVCYDSHARRIRIAHHVYFLENTMHYPTKAMDNPPPTMTFSNLMDTFPDQIYDGDDLNPTDLSEDPTPQTPQASISTDTGHSRLESSNESSDSSSSNRTTATSSTIQQPRRSSRPTRGQLPSRFDDYVAYSVTPIAIPSSYKEAAKDIQWCKAMEEEIRALEENNTWRIVQRPSDSPIIGSRWVYTVKYKPDGSLDRYKARLVAQGYKQEYGIDYDETFAPVAKMQTVRTLLAVASQKQWPLYQLDVKNAFLHGHLKETVYLELPPGYPIQDKGVVCHLNRSLYGLKQAPRAWFETFQGTILGQGFAQSKNDPSLFIKNSAQGITILLIYVDDMVLTGDDSDGIALIKTALQENFKLKDLGNLSYFLGLEIQRSAKGLFLSQKKYIDDLLDSARHGDCSPCSTPMEANVKLSKEEGELVTDATLYRRLVGSLIYLTSTRPDLAYSVQVVSQFMAQPRHPHLMAVYRILRYLQGTRTVGIFLPSNGSMTVTAYADADYAGCRDTRRSTSGWCVKFGEACIAWRCKKQDRVAKSSTEAEYRSMSEVCSEVVWLSRLLTELGCPVSGPVKLYADNTSAIQIASNPVLHDRTKHIETHVHYIRDLIQEEKIKVLYISTEDQIADLLTKAVSTSRHWYLANKLMCRDHHQFGGGC